MDPLERNVRELTSLTAQAAVFALREDRGRDRCEEQQRLTGSFLDELRLAVADLPPAHPAVVEARRLLELADRVIRPDEDHRLPATGLVEELSRHIDDLGTTPLMSTNGDHR